MKEGMKEIHWIGRADKEKERKQLGNDEGEGNSVRTGVSRQQRNGTNKQKNKARKRDERRKKRGEVKGKNTKLEKKRKEEIKGWEKEEVNEEKTATLQQQRNEGGDFHSSQCLGTSHNNNGH